uniref:Regulatory protein zeste n=1 Tax=Timema cristinae TaxID=61476 RepID=A0A7R9CS08_TIMCR|nr:unnamed protein product [Timema cristinae]
MSTNKEESKKTRRCTSAQHAELVDYMSNHSELASERFSCPMGNAAIEQQWEVLASLLEEFGTKKTTTQWKTVWRDLKCRARARLADLNRASKATGNSKTVPPLTEGWTVRNVTLHRDLDKPTIKDHFQKLAQSSYDRLPGATILLSRVLGITSSTLDFLKP